MFKQVTSREESTEAAITTHVEPASQGGCTFYTCECGREAMRRRDLRSDAHRAECEASR